MKENPKLTIITINLNNKEGLRKTIESVVAQTSHNFEYIVIDGGSTDGSIDVIKEYAQYIDYWVSEPDKGIYNAMNKGVQKAHGIFCQFLNSGDWLYSNIVIECMLPYFDLDKDIFVGYTTITENGRLIRSLSGAPKEITLHSLIKRSLSHQSSFIRTKLLLEIPYNESLKIVSDWEFYVNAYLSDAKFAQIPFDIAYFGPGGISGSGDDVLWKEGVSKRRELIHPQLLQEIEKTPPEIINLFNQIPAAYRFKRLLLTINKFMVRIYSLFNKTTPNDKYVNLPPQYC